MKLSRKRKKKVIINSKKTKTKKRRKRGKTEERTWICKGIYAYKFGNDGSYKYLVNGCMKINGKQQSKRFDNIEDALKFRKLNFLHPGDDKPNLSLLSKCDKNQNKEENKEERQLDENPVEDNLSKDLIISKLLDKIYSKFSVGSFRIMVTKTILLKIVPKSLEEIVRNLPEEFPFRFLYPESWDFSLKILSCYCGNEIDPEALLVLNEYLGILFSGNVCFTSKYISDDPEKFRKAWGRLSLMYPPDVDEIVGLKFKKIDWVCFVYFIHKKK